LASVNEILCGWFLKPGSKSNPFQHFALSGVVKRNFETYAKEMTVEEYRNELGRAQIMASAFLDWAVKNGYAHGTGVNNIKTIYWTAQGASNLTEVWGSHVPTGGSGANPTDTLVEFLCGRDNCMLGLSAKSTKGYGEIPFTNPGLGTISQELFNSETFLERTYIGKLEQDMINDRNFGPKLNMFSQMVFGKNWMELGKGQKNKVYKFIDRDPKHGDKEFYQAIKDQWGSPVLGAIRDAILDKLLKMEWEEWSNWMNEFVGSKFKGPYYIKVTGRGDYTDTRKFRGFQAAIELPDLNKKVEGIKRSHVYLEPNDGFTSILVSNTDGVNLFSIRCKWAERPFTSAIKFSGDPKYDNPHYYDEEISESGEKTSRSASKPRTSGKRKT